VTERVIHTSAQLIEKNTLQTPTIIRPRKKINDDIAPVSLIYKRGDDWNTAPLFNGYKKEDLENKEMSIYFPLEIGGEKRNIHLRLKLVARCNSSNERVYFFRVFYSINSLIIRSKSCEKDFTNKYRLEG
jgi:hypothetical protein